MVAPWVLEETQTADFHDRRLDDRFRTILSHLAERPVASIPAACGGHAETAAAYRFFDNDKTDLPSVLAPHREATRQRMRAQPVVLLVQDTSEIELTRPEQQVVGTGPLQSSTRVGVLLHLLHAFTPDGTPLGTVHADTWVRPPEPLSPEQHASQRPIEEKESQRWIDALRVAQAEGRCLPETRIVCIADSEADIFELLVEAQAEPRTADWILRAAQDRALVPEESTATVSAHRLRERLLQEPVRETRAIAVRGRPAKVSCCKRGREQPRQSRTATVETRAARVTLRPPWRPDRRLAEVTVNVVLVREVDPPAGEPPVEWLLLTSLPIGTLEEVRQVIQYYCGRWMVEVFFRTLKSGCRVEARRFERLDRLLPCLGVYLIVAWRTLWVCRMGRSCPDLDCDAVFEPAEWQAVWQVVRREAPPTTPPKLRVMVRMVAQLGGYVNRPRTDEPGPQTVWLGLQRMHDLAQCWMLFGPGARVEPKDV